jgi:plastocyanin
MYARLAHTARLAAALTVGLLLSSLVLLVLLASCGLSSGGFTTAILPTASGPQATVHITGGASTAYQFSPASITIKVGTTVAWINGTDVPHSASSDPGSAVTWDSGAILPSGGTYSFTFTQMGTFPYHCTYHSYMHGTIIVTA